MSVQFTAADVQAIAALARLELSPAEVDLFARQLGDVLGYAQDVLAIDTTNVPPTTSVLTSQLADRADEAQPSLDREAALDNAPDPAFDAGFFRVPRVIG